MEEIGDAAAKIDSSNEFWIVGHFFKLGVRKESEFVFGFRLVSLQFLML